MTAEPDNDSIARIQAMQGELLTLEPQIREKLDKARRTKSEGLLKQEEYTASLLLEGINGLASAYNPERVKTDETYREILRAAAAQVDPAWLSDLTIPTVLRKGDIATFYKSKAGDVIQDGLRALNSEVAKAEEKDVTPRLSLGERIKDALHRIGGNDPIITQGGGKAA